MYTIHYLDSKRNIVTDRACNRIMFLSMIQTIKKYGYQILSIE